MATSDAKIDAEQEVVPEQFVARGCPPNRTVALRGKPDPFTVKVKAGSPAVFELGENGGVITIAGLAVTINDTVFEQAFPPVPLQTMTVCCPAVAREVAGIVALTFCGGVAWTNDPSAVPSQ